MQHLCLAFLFFFVPLATTMAVMSSAIVMAPKVIETVLTAYETFEFVKDIRNFFDDDLFAETVLEELSANLQAIQANHDAILDLKETILNLNFGTVSSKKFLKKISKKFLGNSFTNRNCFS